MSYSTSMYITLTVIQILTVMSGDGDSCSWCNNAPDITTCGVTDTVDWALVRAIGPSKGSWFANKDALQGTDAFLDNSIDQYNIGSFEAVVSGFNQFLFVTGDCSSWLITSKDAIGGPFNNQYYSDTPRTVCSSSKHPNEVSTPKWYNRGNVEDPWISTTDHSPATLAGDILYGENNFGSTHASTVIGPKMGVYVYIRNEQLGSNGCTEPCSICGVCDDCINGECVAKTCANNNYCDGEEYCDPSDGICKNGVDIHCPENMLCDDNEATCVRDCDSFAIDEYLVECSIEFEKDQNNLVLLQEDVELIEGQISGPITERLDNIDGDITDINNDITDTNNNVGICQTDIGNLQSALGALETTVTNNNVDTGARMDGIDSDIGTINADLAYIHEKIDGFKPFSNGKANANTVESGLLGNSLSVRSSGYFDEYKDGIIIGLLVMNMVTMIVCCYILSKRNNKRYRVVSMQESDDEQSALKQ